MDILPRAIPVRERQHGASTLSVKAARKSLTSRDLARLIGVSQSAVSRAFTPDASIAPEMRQRILDAATRFGYEPNAIASMLSTRRSNIVGLVISNLSNPFYPGFLEKLTRALQEQGLQTLLFNITPGSDVKQQLRALRVYNVDALMIVGATVLASADLVWATEGRQTVLLNRVAPDTDIPAVICDDLAGARDIATHFHTCGARRVGYVVGLAHTGVGLDRRNGFIARAAELGMTLSGVTVAGDYSYAAGYRAALELLNVGQPDAIMFANDILAVGGMDALRDERGLRIPQDILVAGFDDIEMAAWPRYNLTTCRQPTDDLIACAVNMIRNPVPTRSSPTITRLPGRIVTRSTTDRTSK